MTARRLTRRRLLAGGAGTAAMAALAACGDGNGRATNGTPLPTPSQTTNGLAPTSPMPSVAATPSRSGGTARLVAPATLSFDTFDAQRAGEPSVAEVLGRTHSRLLEWASFDPLTVGGDLAVRWEQPDPATWVFHLNPAARWQRRAPLNGRPVTAADVVAHLERARSLAATTKLPSAQRAFDIARIRDVTSPAGGVVRIDTEGPDPFLPHTLAARLAFVQAPEAVDAFEKSWHEQRTAEVVGSGPFVFEGPNERTRAAFSAHMEGHRRPRLDGLELVEATSSKAALITGASDEALLRDRRDAASLRAMPAFEEFARFEDSPVVTTLSTGHAPWNNAELVRALSGALNRSWLARELFGGRATAGAPIDPVFGAPFALAPSELARFPGYSPDAEADARAARARWDAAGGAALGTIRIDFPSVFDPVYGASALIPARLNAVLGNRFVAAVEPYTTIGARAAAGEYGNGTAAFWFGWGPPFDDPDPSRLLAETYGPSLPALAADLAALLGELDSETRARRARGVALAVLEAGGGGVLSWLVQRQELFRARTLLRPEPTPFWAQHLDWRAARKV